MDKNTENSVKIFTELVWMAFSEFMRLSKGDVSMSARLTTMFLDFQLRQMQSEKDESEKITSEVLKNLFS